MDDKKDIFAMILENDSSDSTEVSAKKLEENISEDLSNNHDEGKLSVDVARNDSHVFIVSTISGAEAEKIEVFIHNDLLTIRGYRKNPLLKEKNIDFFYSECFWGVFSRTIVLPLEVKGDMANAKYQNGILTISVPIKNLNSKIKIEFLDD
jgi:HSP20 family protein